MNKCELTQPTATSISLSTGDVRSLRGKAGERTYTLESINTSMHDRFSIGISENEAEQLFPDEVGMITQSIHTF